MNTRKLWSCIVLVSGMALMAGEAEAADYVTCESEQDRFQRCFIRDPRNAEVFVANQYSNTPCDQGRTWGVDDRGLWVDRGCRARFEVRHFRDSGSRYGDPRGSYSYDREQRELEQERERLEQERIRLEEERRAAEAARNAAENQQAQTCPPGWRPGRCSDKERRRGCKDKRIESGLGCRTN